MTAYGLTSAEIEQWQKSPVLTPTRQVLLLAAAESLAGVEGRGELFRHALGLTSVAEAQVYLQSVGLLVQANGVQRIAMVLAGVRLPAARRADGRVLVCGAFESVYWTADVASGEAQVRESLPEGVSGRELWLTGSVSERTRRELHEHGWDLHELAEQPGAVPALK